MRFLLTIGDDLYVYDISDWTRATRLTRSPGAKSEATFSPDGRSVAFVKHNNLFVAPVDAPREKALTSDGSAELLNGTLDWVYSEELYGRGNHRGYWWSPDSSHIAFLQIRRDSTVPEYTLIDDIPYRPTVERWHYPKAGDPNPTVRARRRLDRRAARRPLGRHDEVLRLSHRQRRLDARQPRRGLSDSGPAADVARPQSRRCRHGRHAHAPQGNEQGVGRTMAGLERRSALAERRIVSLAQRAQRLAPLLPLRRRRHADSAGDARRVGSPAHPRRRSAQTRGSISRRRNAARSAWICIASGSTAPGCSALSTTDGRHQVVPQSVAHALSRFVERHQHAAAGPPASHDTRTPVRVVDANPCPAL